MHLIVFVLFVFLFFEPYKMSMYKVRIPREANKAYANPAKT